MKFNKDDKEIVWLFVYFGISLISYFLIGNLLFKQDIILLTLYFFIAFPIYWWNLTLILIILIYFFKKLTKNERTKIN